LTSPLAGGVWSASRPCCFTPWRNIPWHPLDLLVWWIPHPVWMIWRCENSWPYQDLKLWPLSCPARRQSLYWLHYHGSWYTCLQNVIFSYVVLVPLFLCLLSSSLGFRNSMFKFTALYRNVKSKFQRKTLLYIICQLCIYSLPYQHMGLCCITWTNSCPHFIKIFMWNEFQNWTLEDISVGILHFSPQIKWRTSVSIAWI
jgi:hypothetical protein